MACIDGVTGFNVGVVVLGLGSRVDMVYGLMRMVAASLATSLVGQDFNLKTFNDNSSNLVLTVRIDG